MHIPGPSPNQGSLSSLALLSLSHEVVAKCTGAFLLKVRPPIHAAVHAIMLSKKHQRSSTVQEEGLTNEDRHHFLLLHKQVHDKRGIAESRQAYINKVDYNYV